MRWLAVGVLRHTDIKIFEVGLGGCILFGLSPVGKSGAGVGGKEAKRPEYLHHIPD